MHIIILGAISVGTATQKSPLPLIPFPFNFLKKHSNKTSIFLMSAITPYLTGNIIFMFEGAFSNISNAGSP